MTTLSILQATHTSPSTGTMYGITMDLDQYRNPLFAANEPYICSLSENKKALEAKLESYTHKTHLVMSYRNIESNQHLGVTEDELLEGKVPASFKELERHVTHRIIPVPMRAHPSGTTSYIVLITDEAAVNSVVEVWKLPDSCGERQSTTAGGFTYLPLCELGVCLDTYNYET